MERRQTIRGRGRPKKTIREVIKKDLELNDLDRSMDTIDVPYFFHKQWQVYPRFFRLTYLGTPFYIRVRQLHNKVYFADGLQHLRKDLQIYESVTITFMEMENKYTFDIFFTPDLHHQSCGRPLLFSREYVWTIEISQSMLSEPRPLRLPNCAMPHVNACGQHMTILRRVGPPLQWKVEALHGMNRYVLQPWYDFVRASDLSHGDELSFYCRIYDKIWEMVIRRKINWDR
ncbi:hypothetical protein HKD37_06G016808 [Glycine soja]